MTQSLEELKAENKANEEQDSKLPTEVAKEDVIKELETDKSTEKKPTQDADLDDGNDDDESKVEGWMQSDEQSADKDGEDPKFTNSDVAAVRRKYKGKLGASEEKATGLEAKVAELEAKLNANTGNNRNLQPKPPEEIRMPKLSQFGYNEDEYEVAMDKWVANKAVSANQQAHQQTSQSEANAEAERKATQAVDDHYQRVDKLVEASNIEDGVYAAADVAVRKAIEEVLPQGGDVITDNIISRLGAGSEKVIYFLGRNHAKRGEMQKLLREDPTGLSTAMMLGQLKHELSGRSNKKSNAPDPSANLDGDANAGESGSKLKRKYENAKDLQTRIDLKRSAKKQGIDVSGW